LLNDLSRASAASDDDLGDVSIIVTGGAGSLGVHKAFGACSCWIASAVLFADSVMASVLSDIRGACFGNLLTGPGPSVVDALRTRRVDGGVKVLLPRFLPSCAAEDLGLEAAEAALDDTEEPPSEEVVDTLRARVVAALGVAKGFGAFLDGAVADE
jgi:hypothetical protein